jgi:hypothetical protein
MIAGVKGLSKAVKSARLLKGLGARCETQIADETFIELSDGLP